MRRIALVSILLLTVAGSASAAMSNTIRKGFNVAEGGVLTIDVSGGDIHVVSGGTGVAVEIVRDADTSSQAKADELFRRYEFTVSQNGNDVDIRSTHERAEWHFFDFGDPIDIKVNVRVPSRYNLNLKTSGGDIRVSSVTGTVDAHTSGGDIELATVNGPANVRTSGGDIDVIGTTGPADVRTSGGSITIKRAGAEVKAHTSGGSIRVEEALAAIDASTSGGSIQANFTVQPKGNTRLSTSGGNVSVSLPAGVNVDLDAHTSGGDVESDLPVTITGKQSDSTLVGKINGGGPQLVLRSSGGGIRVRKM
jgi:DUF4097 and DUF4098 domain-containing protein YvlB